MLRRVTDSVDDELGDDELEDDEDFDYDYAGSRRRRLRVAAAGVVLVAALGLGLGFGLSGSSGPPLGPEGVPLQNVPDLASPDSTVSTGKPVDGITCRPQMDLGISYHVHAHLDIFVNGVQMRIPAGAGIVPPREIFQQPGGPFTDQSSTTCLYWLHVHADDGIIHIEAPKKQAFSLGEFFDIWGQPLSSSQVGPAQGAVVAFVNGQRFPGNPRDIPLMDRELVQLDVGTPVVGFKSMRWYTVTGLCATTCSLPTTTVPTT